MDPETEELQRATARNATAAGLFAAATLPALFDPENPLPSLDRWAELVVGRTVQSGARNIALNQADYMRTRVREVGSPTTWLAEPVVPQAVRSSLFATSGQLLLQGVETYEVALKRAQTVATGAVVRHSMNAGRNSVIRTVKSDAESIGAVYLTRQDERVCYWCTMLASRGPVYKQDSFWNSNQLFRGDGTAKIHDWCRCQVRVVYAKDAPLLAEARELYGQWQEATKGKSGREAMRAWRRHHYARNRELEQSG